MVKAQNGDLQAEEVNKPYYKLTLKLKVSFSNRAKYHKYEYTHTNR